MEKHWKRARVDARIEGDSAFSVRTITVAELALTLPPDQTGSLSRVVKIDIDGQEVTASWAKSDGGRTILLRKASAKDGAKWMDGRSRALRGLAKTPGLQGPVDDAFMASFLFVRPSGAAINANVAAWMESALSRATNEWRAQFRGDVRIKNDVEVSKDDIVTANLVLWGDPQSNTFLGRVIKKLPVQWNAKTIRIAGKSYDSASHIPLLIYPNPLNPQRYVVVNSGFTFPHEGAASNAKQTPKLPDYAVLSIGWADEPSNELRRAGDGAPYHNVVQAGFFDESWQVETF